MVICGCSFQLKDLADNKRLLVMGEAVSFYTSLTLNFHLNIAMDQGTGLEDIGPSNLKRKMASQREVWVSASVSIP